MNRLAAVALPSNTVVGIEWLAVVVRAFEDRPGDAGKPWKSFAEYPAAPPAAARALRRKPMSAVAAVKGMDCLRRLGLPADTVIAWKGTTVVELIVLDRIRDLIQRIGKGSAEHFDGMQISTTPALTPADFHVAVLSVVSGQTRSSMIVVSNSNAQEPSQEDQTKNDADDQQTKDTQPDGKERDGEIGKAHAQKNGDGH